MNVQADKVLTDVKLKNRLTSEYIKFQPSQKEHEIQHANIEFFTENFFEICFNSNKLKQSFQLVILISLVYKCYRDSNLWDN